MSDPIRKAAERIYDRVFTKQGWACTELADYESIIRIELAPLLEAYEQVVLEAHNALLSPSHSADDWGCACSRCKRVDSALRYLAEVKEGKETNLHPTRRV